MSFMTCELRCHHLDRKDQYEGLVSSRKYRLQKLVELQQAINDAQGKLKEYEIYHAKRESFTSLVKNTLSIDWIDRPDLIEKEWEQIQDWLED